MNRDDLIGYFRSADKTSEIIGSRQAGVFMALSELAGHETQASPGNSKPKAASSGGTKKPTKKSTKVVQTPPPTAKSESPPPPVKSKGDMAFTVRIEINLPAEGSAETYDKIFKSIKANLFL
jgi:hypothetical protein